MEENTQSPEVTTPTESTTEPNTTVPGGGEQPPAVDTGRNKDTEKTPEQKAIKERIENTKTAKPLELIFSVDQEVKLEGIPFKVVKVNGLGISLARTDIIG